MFTENQHLVEFSSIMKAQFQRTKRGDFYTHYFIGVMACVAISRHLFWNWSFEDYEKQLSANMLYTPEVIVHVPKRNVFVKLPFLGSTLFQIQKKFQKLFFVQFSVLCYKFYILSKI